MQPDYEAVLEDAVRRAKETVLEGDMADLDMIYIQYHQALLHITKIFQPCAICTTKINMDNLKTEAAYLQERKYTSLPEMIKAFDPLHQDLDQLCDPCMHTFGKAIIKQFYTLHHRG